MADAAKQFTKEYISFATAVDTTRHELPIKNFHIDGDRREFLGLTVFLFEFFRCFILRYCSQINLEKWHKEIKPVLVQ